jgi:hypothetical protein
MEAELAWLADAATFPYSLTAHLSGSTLEIQGAVPNATIQAYALNLAHRATGLTVVDRLILHPGLPLPASSGVPDDVQQEAIHTLLTQYGPGARPFEVRAWSNGQVTIIGNVPTLADKLAVSRCLRRVPGCTSVMNYLHVVHGSMPSPKRVPDPLPAPPVTKVDFRPAAPTPPAPVAPPALLAPVTPPPPLPHSAETVVKPVETDLLAVPALPPSWSAPPTASKPVVPVIPSGLPATPPRPPR